MSVKKAIEILRNAKIILPEKFDRIILIKSPGKNRIRVNIYTETTKIVESIICPKDLVHELILTTIRVA